MASKFNQKLPKEKTEDEQKQLNEKIKKFKDFCEKSKFDDETMREICSPLIFIFRQAKIFKILKLIAIIFITFGILYTLFNFGSIPLHLTAIGRIIMIKLIPLWDWTPMFYETCMIKNPFYSRSNNFQPNCNSCETLDGIDHVSNINYQDLSYGYLQRDAPVIIIDAMDDWQVMKSNDFWFDNITQMYLENEKIRDILPCVMSTNIRPSDDLYIFLKKIQNHKLKKWYIHWQNCDINAVKAFRKFHHKPYYLSSSVSSAHLSWIFMSLDYAAKVYKPIDLDVGLIQLMQLRGSTIFNIKPLDQCNETCSEIHGELFEGEILVFNNHIWNFEYLPRDGLDNIAILTETVWEQLINY